MYSTNPHPNFLHCCLKYFKRSIIVSDIEFCFEYGAFRDITEPPMKAIMSLHFKDIAVHIPTYLRNLGR